MNAVTSLSRVVLGDLPAMELGEGLIVCRLVGDAPSLFLVIRGALVGADRESSEPGGWSFEPLDL